MEKFGEQIPFDFEELEEKKSCESDGNEKNVSGKKTENKEEDKKPSKEERIIVEEVSREKDSITGELCFRVSLFWEVVQQPITFLYYPKGGKLIWTRKPSVDISDSWWKAFTYKARSVGKDHYKRYLREEEQEKQTSLSDE